MVIWHSSPSALLSAGRSGMHDFQGNRLNLPLHRRWNPGGHWLVAKSWNVTSTPRLIQPKTNLMLWATSLFFPTMFNILVLHETWLCLNVPGRIAGTLLYQTMMGIALQQHSPPRTSSVTLSVCHAPAASRCCHSLTGYVKSTCSTEIALNSGHMEVGWGMTTRDLFQSLGLGARGKLLWEFRWMFQSCPGSFSTGDALCTVCRKVQQEAQHQRQWSHCLSPTALPNCKHSRVPDMFIRRPLAVRGSAPEKPGPYRRCLRIRLLKVLTAFRLFCRCPRTRLWVLFGCFAGAPARGFGCLTVHSGRGFGCLTVHCL